MHNIARILLTRAKSKSAGAAFTDHTGTITYCELERRSQQFAAWLRAQGLRPGQRVCVVLPDSIHTVTAFLGTVLAGGVAVITSPQTRDQTIDYKIHTVDPLVKLDQHNINQVMHDSQQLSCDLTVTGGGKDTAFMLWTSGTTGHVKAVMHSHENVVAQCVAYSELTLGMTTQDKIYSTAKLSFAYGIINSLFGCMWVGAHAYLDHGLATPIRVKHIVDAFAPTMFFSVPVLYSQLVTRWQPLSNIKYISAGDRLPDALLVRWKHTTGQVIHNCLGTSECLTAFVFNHAGTAGIGQAIPMYHVRIVNDQGQVLAAGESGHLQVLAPSAGLGYWQDEEWTAKYFQHWISTGDVCWQDHAGNLYHMGRTGDVMKIAGHFINPSELEETLDLCPGVEQSAVISVSNAHGIERIEAYVVGQVQVRDVRAWMHKHHDRYRCPRKIHLVTQLPRTDTGKIQRHKLRTDTQLM